VRVSRIKTIFEKGFHPNWSLEIFRIVSTADGIRAVQPAIY